MRKLFILISTLICLTSTLSANWGQPIDIYTDNPAGYSTVGIDAEGNAWIAYSWLHLQDANVSVTSLVNGVKGSSTTFSVAPFTGSPVNALNIAVNATGDATLIWTELNTAVSPNASFVRAASFLNGSWSSPSSLTNPSVEDVYSLPETTIDTSNKSIGIWLARDGMTSDANVSYDLCNSGTWAGETDLTSPSSDFIPTTYLSGSSSGHAFALWPNLGTLQLQGSYFNGTSWATNSNISSDLQLSCTVPVAVSMNSSNQALLIWTNSSQGGGLNSILFDAGTYGTAKTIFTPETGVGVESAAVALDDTGDGAVIWAVFDTNTSTASLYFSSYSEGNWGSPILLDSLVGSIAYLLYPKIGLDGQGNAILAWQRKNQDSTTAVMASSMAKGALIASTPILISTDTNDGQAPDLAVNSSGQAVICWQNGPDLGSAIQAAIYSLAPSPPRNLQGEQIENRFITQKDSVNVLHWKASQDASTVKYFIFRNGVKVGAVAATSPLTYQDHNRSEIRTFYEVTAVNETGAQSSPISVYLP